MFINYLKLALRILGRNKFFTAITLFGISFTLAILMLIVSFLETEIGSTAPATAKESIVILPAMTMQRRLFDTIYTVDTSMLDGVMVLDSTYKTQSRGRNMSRSSYSLDFLEKYFTDIPSAVNYTFFNTDASFNVFVNNTKIELLAAFVDNRFWEVLDFEFLEGNGFGSEVYDQAEQVAVITDDLADEYFGRKKNVLGEEILMDGKNFKVIGLIKEPGISLMSSDIYVPSSVLNSNERGDEEGFGGFSGLLMAARPSDVTRLKSDVAFKNSQIPLPPGSYFNEIITEHHTYYEYYAQQMLYFEESEKSLSIMTWVLIGLLSLFVLLPTLNLINLNVSRIMERSSEIGVRKAFGASQGTILGQFVFENVVQTLLGGAIGFGLALILINIINTSRLLEDVILRVNVPFFIYSLVICLLFGVVSGVLPAYRMSKIHIVNALKQSKI